MTKRILTILATCILTTAAYAGTPVRIGWLTSMGPTSDLCVDATRQLAYMATTNGCLAVVDVQNPSAPWIRGFAPPDGTCSGTKISRSADIVAVAGGNTGAVIFDVANAQQPLVVGKRAGNVLFALVGAARVYTIENVSGTTLTQVFRTLDISGNVLGSVTLPGNQQYRDAQRCAGKPYLLTSSGGVIRIDTTVDSAPTIAANVTIPATNNAKRMSCDGSDVWVSRYMIKSDGVNIAPVVTRLDGTTLTETYAYNSVAIGLDSLWVRPTSNPGDAGKIYGSLSAVVGRTNPAETATGQATAVQESNGLMYTAHVVVDTINKKIGGLSIYSFSGAPPTVGTPSTPTRTHTPTIGASTPTRTHTATPQAVPTCYWQCPAVSTNPGDACEKICSVQLP